MFVVALTTLPSTVDSSRLARTLIEERLVACVNVLPPMRSVYQWKGQVEEASEQQLIMKTTASRMEDLKARLGELHPYEVPELLVLPVSDGAPPYLDWIAESTSRGRG